MSVQSKNIRKIYVKDCICVQFDSVRSLSSRNSEAISDIQCILMLLKPINHGHAQFIEKLISLYFYFTNKLQVRTQTFPYFITITHFFYIFVVYIFSLCVCLLKK